MITITDRKGFDKLQRKIDAVWSASFVEYPALGEHEIEFYKRATMLERREEWDLPRSGLVSFLKRKLWG